MLSRLTWISIVVLIGVAACTAPPQTATPSPAAVRPSATARIAPPAPTPPPPTATSSPTPPPGCRGKGEIRMDVIDAPTLNRPLHYRIYLPPCYGSSERRFPAVYLLHGLASTDSQWDDLGADEAADRLISAGAVPPLILVMPWEQSGQPLEQAITEALIPEIEARYRTSAQRAIGGISRGGGLALQIGFKHAGLFEGIGLHSPAVLQAPYLLTRWAEAIAPSDFPRIWLDIGDRDPLRPKALQELEDLRAAGLTVSAAVYPGGHDAAYWAAHVESYLRWYGSLWPEDPFAY